MSNDIMSDSLCSEKLEPFSKNVTKVQRLPNISEWNDYNAILRDFIKIFFTKRSSVFRTKQHLPIRKRVCILTPDDILLVYETNCTGYSFNIRTALRMKISCLGHNREALEKSCSVTLKYKFGYVNLVLVNNQISVWRRTICAIFERESFNGNLLNDLSLYTAKDDDIDETLITNRSNFNYTESVISLKSARGFMDLSPSQENVAVNSSENTSLKTNSNRSSTCLPLTLCTTASLVSVASNRRNNLPVDNNNSNNTNIKNNPISVRQGSLAVSYLAKQFESRMGIGKKTEKNEEPRICASSPLEVLFPPLPEQKLEQKQEKEVKNEDEKM